MRELGLAVASVVAVWRIADLAMAGRVTGDRALLAICFVVVPGLALVAGKSAVAALLARRR